MTFRDQSLPHRQGTERTVLQRCPQIVQEPRNTNKQFDVGGGEAVHAGGVRAGVTRDPGERHQQRRRVVHKVEQVVEPATRIGHRPTVKLGLHTRYPEPRFEPWVRTVSRSWFLSVLLSITLAGPAPSGSADTSRLCQG